jgi:hypothetical protein
MKMIKSKNNILFSHLTKTDIIMYNYTNICINNILIKIWYN